MPTQSITTSAPSPLLISLIRSIDLLFGEVDDVGGAGLARHGDPLRYGFDRDDPLRAQHFGGLDREQAHGTRAPDRHDFSALDAGLLGSLIAEDPLHLVERHFLGPAIIKLRRAACWHGSPSARPSQAFRRSSGRR